MKELNIKRKISIHMYLRIASHIISFLQYHIGFHFQIIVINLYIAITLRELLSVDCSCEYASS